jgi:hypothetical protein
MYDLIGDIHGHSEELEALLLKLGYHERDGAYRHPDRLVIFIGDFVDRGPNQKRVLQIVRSMVDAGRAKAVMGNHEYNAIGFFTEGETGDYLRPRNKKNTRQHQAFLDEYAGDLVEWRDTINWFRELPLWLDLEDFRAVHACWDATSISLIEERYGGSFLTEKLLFDSSKRGTWQFDAIETILKGKEIELPDSHFFHDKDGNRRHEIRVRWWSKGDTYRDVYMGPESALTHIPEDPIQADHLVEYGLDEKPVFLGHYWMEGEPLPLADNIACLDYSVAKPGGKLVAYRWDGEKTVDASKYVFCQRSS